MVRDLVRVAVVGVVLSAGAYLLAVGGTLAVFVVADWWQDRGI